MKKLQLPLKTEWFEMTKARIKKEDYRSITPHWLCRFLNFKGASELSKLSMCEKLIAPVSVERDYLNGNKTRFNYFDINVMTLGYPKTGDKDRILELEHKGIEIREGNPDWGAEPGVLYFCIIHGNILPN